MTGTVSLYHTTDCAELILDEGFRDGEGWYGFAHFRPLGVFLSRSPANVNDGAKGDQVLVVTLPDDLPLDTWAISEEGRDVWEWCIPAHLLNERGLIRLLTEEEVDHLL